LLSATIFKHKWDYENQLWMVIGLELIGILRLSGKQKYLVDTKGSPVFVAFMHSDLLMG